MTAPRPQILTAVEQFGEIALVADGTPIAILSREHAIWLIARLAQALVRSA